jgi:hypothetical protein
LSTSPVAPVIAVTANYRVPPFSLALNLVTAATMDHGRTPYSSHPKPINRTRTEEARHKNCEYTALIV